MRTRFRKQQSKVVIVDDAHFKTELLTRLKQLRREINAEFDIVATSWTGDKAVYGRWRLILWIKITQASVRSLALNRLRLLCRMSSKLTAKQNLILGEIRKLAEVFGMDYENILDYDPDSRTTMLEVMKNKMIRGQVIIWYTLVDEYLNMEICQYFFGKKRSFPQLWKTKRFQLFNYHVLEELYPLQKLRLVRAIRPLPKTVVRTIESLNALRNGLAHSFFPENLKKSKPTRKGKSIFSAEGGQLFMEDMHDVSNCFIFKDSDLGIASP